MSGFNLDALIEKLEGSYKNRRWKAGGMGIAAVLFGFKRPDDLDECGVWNHPIAGSFVDHKMPAVIELLLEQYMVRMGDPELIPTLYRFAELIDLMAPRISMAMDSETDPPTELGERVYVLMQKIGAVRQLVGELTLERGSDG